MFTTGSDLELQKIETYVIKVNINCEGCKQRVKKLLRKIEGVFSVDVDEDEQVVRVTGKVEPTTLIKKLIKSGKHAEFWSPSSSHLTFSKGDSSNGRRSTFGYELAEEDVGNYLYYNATAKNPITGDPAHQNLIQGTNLDEDTLGNNGHMISMMDGNHKIPAGFEGNVGTAFVGSRGQELGMFHEIPSRMPTYEYNNQYPHLSSMIKTSLQHGYHHNNNPSAQMDRHRNDNVMANYDNINMYLQQHDRMSYLSPLIPPPPPFTRFRNTSVPNY